MKFVTRRLLATAVIAAAFWTSAASAQDLDAPSVQVLKTRSTSIRIAVQAGASGAQAGFRVDWIERSAYDAAGGWPAADDPRIQHADFTGVPTLIVQGDAGDFTLPPQTWQAVSPGDLFDETGALATSTNELKAGTDYVLRVVARGDGTSGESAPSATLFASTDTPVQNCTHSEGFWKNHPELWPVTNLTLGTVNYTAAQLLSILNTSASGNGLISLAHQLITAKLSIADGADPSAAASLIANADALIGNKVVPPVGSDSLSPGSVSSLVDDLTDYNTGKTGPGHCAETPAKVESWGTLKATYRR